MDLTEVYIMLGKLNARIDSLEQEQSNYVTKELFIAEMDTLKELISKDHEEIRKFGNYFQRGFGIFSFITALGAILAWVVSQWDKFASLFKHLPPS